MNLISFFGGMGFPVSISPIHTAFFGVFRTSILGTNEMFGELCTPYTPLLGQWLNFKLFGITYLVGKIKFKLFFSGSIG